MIENTYDGLGLTVEARIKEIARDRYGSVLQFTNAIGMPYTTFDSMIKRGINNSIVENVLKVCEGLSISPEALYHGRIEPMIYYKSSVKVEDNPTGDNVELFESIDSLKTKISQAEVVTARGLAVDKHAREAVLEAITVVELAIKGVADMKNLEFKIKNPDN